MFDAIYKAIGSVLGWMNDFTGSYVIALFIFAIFVEVLLLPFGIKQQKNSIKQARLRPKEMAIRNKYKGRNDQATMQKMNMEIQELYRNEGYSPMGGCLPLLIQLPIIMILYRIVTDPLQYVVGMSSDSISTISSFITTAADQGGLGLSIGNNGTIGMLDIISNFSAENFAGLAEFGNGAGATVAAELQGVMGNLPNFSFFGLSNLALTPGAEGHLELLLIPFITFGVYFGSMRLTRKFSFQPQMANTQQQGCSNNMMDITMPLMSTMFTFMLPGVIGVYWIFKSILSTLKQFLLSKVMPLPTFTEEDFKQAEKEMKAQNKGKTYYRNEDGSKPRSLHHIDDDDYEQPEEPARPKKADTGMASLVDTPTLKDDDKDAKEADKEETETTEEKED